MMDKNFLPPEERELAEQLESLAQRLKPNAAFERELEKRLMQSQSPEPKAKGFWPHALPTLGWAAGLILLALALNVAIRSLGPQPGAGNTATPVPVTENTPAPAPNETLPTPKSAGEAYDWNGMQLYLNAPLPGLPNELPLYLAQPDRHATIEDARALAARFGMNGQVYLIPPEVPGTADNDFLIVDGNQRLQVRSDQYFIYYPDYTRLTISFNPVDYPDAKNIITDFLDKNAFDSNYLDQQTRKPEYRIEQASTPGTYMAMPLTSNRYPIYYEYFSNASLTFQFDTDGLFSVSASLVQYAPVDDKAYPIISAEEAFQKLFDTTGAGGYMIGQTSPYQSLLAWTRPRRENETVTVWGWMNSYPSANGGASLVTLDGFNVIGNVADVPSNMPNTFVETVGQFQTVDNVKVFNVESWKVYDGYEDGIFGSLQREGESVVMTTEDGAYILPDVPQDVPIPVDNMYATGIKKGDIFEWKTLDNRPSFGGGGGGGGGYGFYKLNLSGTPVPFATPTSDPAIPDANANGYPYVVAAGDTCHSIASMFNLDVNTLIVTNNLAADCSDLTLDQTIIIPYTTAMPPEVAQIRGILSSTIFESADGSQRTQYGLINMSPANVPETFYYYILEGDNLEGLQSYYGRPVDVWGTVERITDDGIVKLRVDRYEIPFPDLQLQVLKGVEKSVQLEGQSVLLFTDGGGNTYVELGQNCYEPVGGKEVPDSGNEIQMEALAVPGLTYAGQPAVCMFNSALLADPNTKKPIELTITADQPSILPEMPSAEAGNLPTITIEKVELIYYLPNQRYLSTSSADPVYIQPIWRFYGHYSDGSVFEALVQALDPLFLLPEFDSDTQPG